MKVCLLAILVIYSMTLQAYQGRIVPGLGGSLEIRAGQSFTGLIRLWPYRGKSFEKLWALSGSHLSPHFYVHKVINVGLSPNNNEVLEIEARIILKTDFGITSFVIADILGVKVPLTIRDIKVVQEKEVPMKMHILNQDVESDLGAVILRAISAVTILLIVSGTIYMTATSKGRRRKREIEKVRKKWRKRLSEVESRAEIEQIYKCRKEWMSFYSGELGRFVEIVESNQYQREWSEVDITEVKNMLREISTMLRGSGEV